MEKIYTTKFSSTDFKSGLKLHYLWIILPLVIAGGLYALSYVMFHDLPTPLTQSTESNREQFIELYARNKLDELSSIGPRLVGSEANELQAVQFLTNEVEQIKKQALTKYIIEYEVQRASFGSYIQDDMVDIYKDIKNFVVRLSSVGQNSSSALLVNSHFDTVPESSGAGDDGTMVAVMLEILRVLSTSSKTLKHPVIFLFNGAEENSMQGSHAFITQHRWAEDVKAFINLDVAGIGGREMLFQSGPGHPWLVEHYSKSAVHPYGLTIAEEVFQNKFIPSDTDFRVFRDYGKIPGLDLAQSYNGFVYHTKLDRFSGMSTFGSLQNTGDNVLALIRSIASSKELENPDDYAEGQTIFFDFLGLFLIHYTETVGIAINISISIVSLTAIVLSIWSMYRTLDSKMINVLKKFIVIFLIQVAAMILAIGVIVLIAVVIDWANVPLFWFSQQWLIFGIYLCPYCFIMAMIPTLYLNMREHEIPLRYGVQLFLHAQCIVFILLVVAITCLSIRSAFVITIGIMFYSVAVIVNWAFRLQSRAFLWLIPILLSQIIPFLYYSYLSQIIYTTFIPILGRSGLLSNPEILIAAFTVIVALLTTGFLAPLFSIYRKSKTIICGFMAIFIGFAIILATPLAFPFTKGVAPQRHWVFHTERTIYASNGMITHSGSGFVLIPLDRYAPTTIPDIISGRKYNHTGNECTYMPVCGVPVYASNFKSQSNYSYWIPSGQPNIPNEYKPNIRLVEKTKISETIVRYEMEISGPAHLQVFFNPIRGSQLVNWSVSDEFPDKHYFKESTYFLHFRHGRESQGFQFYLDFKTPFDELAFDIALIAHHNNYPVEHTGEFKEFLSSYPEWVTLTPIVSSYIGLRV